MVTHENLASAPHQDGWLGISGAVWEAAYRYAIASIQVLLARIELSSVDAVASEYDRCMDAFERMHPATQFQGQWRYAAGIIGTQSPRHPFHLNPVDRLRWNYLPEWGWGTDPRVSDYLSVGALRMFDRSTGKDAWKAVKGIHRKWAYLDPRNFSTEREALDCARVIVEGQYLSPPGKFRG